MMCDNTRTRIIGAIVTSIWSIALWASQFSPSEQAPEPSIEKTPPVIGHIEEDFEQFMRDWR